ncbi:hypothetical protein BH10PSE6_BH10PSE6_01680 [soil metagenome]
MNEPTPSRKVLPSTQDLDLTGVLPDDVLKEPIESFVGALADPSELPIFAIGMCAVRYTEAAPLLRAALERAATGSLRNEWDDLLFFRGLHIIGGRRDPLGCEPLLRFLRRQEDELEALLGDAVWQSLPQIVAGVYDGNADALFEAIADQTVDHLVRDSLLRAAAFITWEGRIERARTVAFLERFYRDRLALDGELAWDSWAMTIALLGLRDMVPIVEAAEARGVFDEHLWDRTLFDTVMAEAEQAPDDITRFSKSDLGYIEDVIVALQQYDLGEEIGDEDEDSMYPGVEPDVSSWSLPAPKQVFNPLRHVGRNDPCPCGSGKKAKRCCLAA